MLCGLTEIKGKIMTVTDICKSHIICIWYITKQTAVLAFGLSLGKCCSDTRKKPKKQVLNQHQIH